LGLQQFATKRPVMPEQRPVLNPTESRQGFLDRPVLMVLVVSLALAALAFGILILPNLI
jgi:hypothetical protein